MILKKLELFGFKSFADKTTLEFSPGITAVVGPNGCGKSNLVDAIKWVLGEQSPTHLRGTKMEDIIFNGTGKVSPLNIAEVSLSFSNHDHLLPVDYDEITITRRGFRSGESEYYINKTQVRLKDILELFMGTGIGTNAYSLMEQGKIDLILSSRPQDRRYVFEEASGITKYKTKKKEALRKLEQTQVNLQRVDDIIKEVMRQINSIKRQVKKCEKYNLEFDKLKKKMIRISCYDFIENKKKIDNLTSDIELHKNNCKAINEKIETQNKKVSKIREELDKLDEELIKMQEKKSNLITLLENNRNRIALNEIRIKEEDTRREQLLDKINEVKEKRKQLSSELEQNQKDIQQIENRMQSIKQLIDNKDEEFKNIQEATKTLSKSIPQYKADILDLTNQETKFKNDLNKINADLKIYYARKKRLETELGELNNEKSDIESKLKRFLADVEEIKKKISIQEEIIQTGKLRIEEHRYNIGQLNQKLNSKIEILQKQKAKLEILDELKKNYEESSSLHSEIVSKLSGVYGVISNLIEIAPNYEKCIKVALGDNLETLIIENIDIVPKLLSYFKNLSNSQIKMLLLNRIKEISKLNNTQYLNNHQFVKEENFKSNYIKPALNFVKVKEDNFLPLINYLFHNIFIVEDLEYALELAKTIPKNIKLVTPQRDLLTFTYIKIGHNKEEKKLEDLLSEKNLRNIGASISTVNSEIEEIKNQIQDEKSKVENVIVQDMKKAEDLISSFEIKINENKIGIDKLKTENHKIKDEILITTQELNNINEEIDAFIIQEKGLKEKLDGLNQKNNDLVQKLSLAQNQISVNTKNREQLLVEKLELQSEFNTLSEKFSNKENMQKVIKERLDEQDRLSGEILEQISLIENNNRQLREENFKLEKDIENIQQNKAEVMNKIEQEYKRRNSKLLDIRTQEELLNSYQKQYSQAKQELDKFDIKVRELFFKMENIKENVERDYKISLEEVLKNTPTSEIELTEEEKEKELSEIEEIKKNLDSIGPVNLLAVEEHNQLNERFEFLSKQRKDLEDSKLSLHKAIQKINRTTRELFMDTFQKVQKEFHNYFRLIFGGGRASLKLVEETDVLESGIDITAQPPGKKLQSISLLSGGEKTLCAIALLFALFRVKPSPFCILDEIDASLDEANVARFNQILKEFTHKSQFIIITHNKKTISMSDVMYGVTMEESGISKIVSVKFVESKTH